MQSVNYEMGALSMNNFLIDHWSDFVKKIFSINSEGQIPCLHLNGGSCG